MNENSKVEMVHRFFSGTGPTYDSIANLCTLGFDARWKEKILEKIPQRSIHILDQACGTGILTFAISRRFPHARIVGVELREEYLALARAKAKNLNLGNVEFILGRAEDIFLDGGFDCVTSSYLAKYAQMGALIRNIAGMLRRGGLLIMQDFTYPSGNPFARVWELYFKVLQRVGSWRYPEWRIAFYELPEFIRKTKWVEEAVAALKKNGFGNIRSQSLTWGASTMVTAERV
jgi:demethylmenaquinone methyltransferase/2-methoxy-6-polyprenyl-1,4-benzoquinol methylase